MRLGRGGASVFVPGCRSRLLAERRETDDERVKSWYLASTTKSRGAGLLWWGWGKREKNSMQSSTLSSYSVLHRLSSSLSSLLFRLVCSFCFSLSHSLSLSLSLLSRTFTTTISTNDNFSIYLSLVILARQRVDSIRLQQQFPNVWIFNKIIHARHHGSTSHDYYSHCIIYEYYRHLCDRRSYRPSLLEQNFLRDDFS